MFLFFFNDTATTEIYTLSLHDALPIYGLAQPGWSAFAAGRLRRCGVVAGCGRRGTRTPGAARPLGAWRGVRAAGYRVGLRRRASLAAPGTPGYQVAASRLAGDCGNASLLVHGKHQGFVA